MRIRLFSLPLIAIAATIAATITTARADPLPPLPLAQHAHWQAIGRVNVAGYNRRGMCSGTLIDANTVLTAAHCLLKPDLRLFRTSDITFVAGWRRGAYAGVAKPVSVTLHPKALVNGALQPAFDLALLHLDTPIPVSPIPVAALPPAPVASPPYAIIGYYDRRPHMLSARFDCNGRTTQRGLVIACPTRPGNSGGPILARIHGDWRVVAVVSAGNTDITIGAFPDDFVLH